MKNLLLLIVTLFFGLSAVAQCNNVPIINNFTPNTGFIGSTVTINGANFDANPANNQVFFGATQAQVISASFGVLQVVVPVGATLAPIAVKNQCNKIAYSRVPFNGIFCPTPLTQTTYNSTAFTLSAKGAYNMLSMDIDLDGKPDVVSGGVSAGGFTIARNLSTPGNLNFVRVDINVQGPQGHAVADFDGDGKVDICYARSAVYVIRNTSTPGNITFGPEQTVRSGFGAYQITIADINNDGKVDILSEGGNFLRTFRNTSTGPGVISFVENTAVLVHDRCTGLQAADADGDGLVDVLGTQGNSNRAITVRNVTVPGSAVFAFETNPNGLQYEVWPSNGNYPYRCQIADFDKDGKIDLTTCNFNDPTNTAIFRNTSTVGNISFATTVNLPAPTANYRIGVGDADGDGFPDIVTKSLGINVFSVYRNTSTGPGVVSFAPRFDYTSSDQAEVSGIVIADLDGDFVPDIATSGINSNTIRFHRNTSSQNDVTPPTAVCQNITAGFGPNGTVTITPQDVDNGSSDACGLHPVTPLTLNLTQFTCANIGANPVTLTVMDNAGNISTCTAIVNVAPAAIIVAGQTTVCQGGVVAMTANLGDSYQWFKDGVAIPGATAQSYNATVTGNYTVQVINAGGCSGISDPLLATINLNPTVSVTASGPSLCGAGSSVILTASNSSIYQWKKDGVNIPGAIVQTLTVTTPGTYSVNVVDVFGCSAVSQNVVITTVLADINVTGNGITIVDGDITPNPADNTNWGTVFPGTNYPKSFVIQNTGTDPLTINGMSLSGANASAWTIAAGSFPFTIAANSSAPFTLTFNGPSLGTYGATLSIQSNDCNEGVYDFALAAEITCVAPSVINCPSNIAIGTNGFNSCNEFVSYQVTFGGLPDPTLSYVFSGATNGSGAGSGSGSQFQIGLTTVTVTASNPCGNATCSFTVTIFDDEDPEIVCPNNITVTSPTTSCEASVSWGLPYADDICSPPAMLTSTHNPGDIFPLGTTTVTYTATDGANNSVTCSFDVTVLPQPLQVVSISAATYAGGANVSCNGASDGSATVVVSGGCTPYTYAWTGGQANATATGLSAGTYTVTITDANGTVTSTSITLTEPAVLVASSSSTAIACIGGQSTVTVSATGGTAPYTGTGTFSRPAGTYTFNVTDANGCATSTTITITEPTQVVASATSSAIACFGGQSTVTVTGAGGTPGYTGTGTFSRPAGTHTFTVTDANGCSDDVTITIGQPTLLVASSSSTAIACNGGQSTVTVSATGGTAPYTGTGTFSRPAGTYTFNVTDANGCATSTTITITEPTQVVASATSSAIACFGGQSTVTVTGAGGTPGYTGTGTFSRPAGTHTFVVTDANGCSDDVTITIGQPTLLVASATATEILCNAETTDITVTAVGGTLPYSGNVTYTESAGTYTYTVTDAKGCNDDVTITVTEPTQLELDLAGCSTVYGDYGWEYACANITATASNGTPGYSYDWSTNESTSSVIVCPDATTTYSVTATDSKGCQVTQSWTVEVVDLACNLSGSQAPSGVSKISSGPKCSISVPKSGSGSKSCKLDSDGSSKCSGVSGSAFKSSKAKKGSVLMCFEGETYCVKKKYMAKKMLCGFTLGPCDAQQTAACNVPNGPDSVVSNCPCDGRIVSMVVRYIGPSNVDLTANAKDCGVNITSVSGATTGAIFYVNAADAGLAYLRNTTYLSVDGSANGQVAIPTNCCDNPVGRTFFPFQVLAWQDESGNVCDYGGGGSGGGNLETSIGQAGKDATISENGATMGQYPNPADHTSTFEFTVPTAEEVTMTIVNMRGEVIATIFNGAAEANRNYTVTYDVSKVQSGIYFAHLTTSNGVFKKKFVVLK